MKPLHGNLARIACAVLLLSGIATSCVRSVYVVRDYPLAGCPDQAFAFQKEYVSEASKLQAVKARNGCAAAHWYEWNAREGGLPERLRSAFVGVAIERSGDQCGLRVSVEVFCGKNQSLEECRKALPYQKEKIGMEQASEFAQRRVLETLVKSEPVLARISQNADKNFSTRLIDSGCP